MSFFYNQSNRSFVMLWIEGGDEMNNDIFTYDWILEMARKHKGADVYYKDEWGAYVFFVGGKMFGMLGEDKEDNPILSLKGLPEDNEVNRDMFSFVKPGYYLNKTHWISILLETKDLDRQWIASLIESSYTLVFKKLPKKVRLTIE